MTNLKSTSFIALTVLMFAINSSVRVHSTHSEETFANSSTVAKSRMKRYLNFQQGSRILFRVNVKDNVIKNNQIFAHAFGFRANIDLIQPHRPDISPHIIRRREVYDTLEELINQHGFDGRACILKTFCDASEEVTPQSGMLFKLFKLIFTQYQPLDNNTIDDNERLTHPLVDANNCDELEKHCPLSLLEISPYTDM